MSGVFITNNGRARIVLREFIRNGKAPVAELQSKLAETIGHATRAHPKQIFHRYSPIGAIPASAGSSRTRWRFAFHSGPYAALVCVRMEIAPEDDGTPGNPYCQLDIATADAPTVTVGTARVVYGSSDGSFADVPWNMGGGFRVLDDGSGGLDWLEPDTEYVGTFYDYDHARLFGAVVYEVSLDPDTDNGYPAVSYGVGGPIFYEDRAAAQTMSRTLYMRTASPLWHGGSESNSTARTLAPEVSITGALAASIGEFGLVADGTVAIQGALSKSIGTFGLVATGTVPTPDLSGGTNWSVNPVSPGNSSDVTVALFATGSDQTLITLNVRIGDIGGGKSGLLAVAPSATLGGWTQSTSWSNASGDYWEANFTRATLTLAAGVVNLVVSVQANPSSVEEYEVRMSAGSAEGGSFVLSGIPLSIAPAFEATITTPTDGSSHITNNGTTPLACTATIIAQGAAQTDGTVTIVVRDNYDSHIQGVTTTDLDGWTQSGAWAGLAGVWSGTFTKATVTPGTYEIDFSIDWTNDNNDHTTISTNDAGAPQTDQSTGTGNDVVIDVNLT